MWPAGRTAAVKGSRAPDSQEHHGPVSAGTRLPGQVVPVGAGPVRVVTA